MPDATDPDSMPQASTDVRTDRAHTARIYDYLLGGKDNYAADREAAQQLLSAFPSMATAFRSQRAFMRRSAQYVAECGLDQFLDIGTGIPTEPNLHQVVQAVEPTAHLLYVDNDPIVLAHAAALMVGDHRGSVSYLHADARDVESIVGSTELGATLDLDRPIAVSIIGLLHFLDDEAALRLVHDVLNVLRPGSYLTLSQATSDVDEDGSTHEAADRYRAAGIQNWLRSRDQVQEMFLSDLEVVEPGLVLAHRWRPDASGIGVVDDTESPVYGVVARKR